MTIHEFLTAFIIGLIFGGGAFGFAGYWLATHIHSVADKAATAVARATTVPAGVVSSLDKTVPGIGTALQSAATAAGTQAADALAKAAAPAQS